MEKNEDDNNKSNDNSKKKEDNLPFGSKENAITVLNDLFKHGQNLPFNSILGTSIDERQSKLDSALELTETFLKNKPSIVGWLRSNLFEESNFNVPMALLFIALYEQHSLPQKETECDFRYDVESINPSFYFEMFCTVYINFMLILFYYKKCKSFVLH